MPVGRPTKYTQELADYICEQLSAGISMRTISEEEGMPDRRNIYRWLRLYPEFCLQYERAKHDSADALVEDMQAIADDMSVEPAHKKIMVDTRKWAASKLKVKKYGDRIAQEHTGANGGPIQVQEIVFNPVSNESSD